MALSPAEKQARYRARVAAERAEEEAELARLKSAPGSAGPAPEKSIGELHLELIHLKMDPKRTAYWILQRLGPDTTRAIRNALDAALAGDVPEEAA